MLLHELVSDAAERWPDSLALSQREAPLSYAELETASRRLAKQLVAHGCRRGETVCILIPKSSSAIVAILAVLRSGAAYVPLDTASPPARVAEIVRTCRPRLVLTVSSGAPQLAELVKEPSWTSPPLGFMDNMPDAELCGALDLSNPTEPHTAPPAVACRPADAAYIMFTSGSTGKPKGVVVSHESVIEFTRWATKYFDVTPEDRLSGHSPLHFDLSVYDVFGALSAGAQLALVPPTLNLIPHRLRDFMQEQRITQWFSVPSILTYMANTDALRDTTLPDLRALHWCGEVFPTAALAYWMEHLPGVRFTNLYGPTEATIASSYYEVAEPPAADADVPIGTACPGERLLMLDERLDPVAPGEPGHLFIGGIGLSRAYLNDPIGTASAFLPDPYSGDPGARMYRTGDMASEGPDGEVHFLGREDAQVKSRGYRIELGEIENALSGVGLVREGVVVAVPDLRFGGKSICCAYVPVRDVLEPAELRRELARSLPGYMLPSRWQSLESLPRNTNGKIDRRALRELFTKADA